MLNRKPFAIGCRVRAPAEMVAKGDGTGVVVGYSRDISGFVRVRLDQYRSVSAFSPDVLEAIEGGTPCES